jgi:hypothetical protein
MRSRWTQNKDFKQLMALDGKSGHSDHLKLPSFRCIKKTVLIFPFSPFSTLSVNHIAKIIYFAIIIKTFPHVLYGFQRKMT